MNNTKHYKWIPDQNTINKTNLSKAINHFGLDNYQALYDLSITNFSNLLEFYLQQIDFRFNTPYSILLESSNPKAPHWLKGSRFSLTANCLKEPGSKTAIIEKDSNGQQRNISYQALTNKVGQISSALRAEGINQTSAVAIIMPMTIEAVCTYLAIINLGATVISIAESFSVKAIQDRLAITQCNLIVTQDLLQRAGKSLPIYEKIQQASKAPCVVLRKCEQTKLQTKDKDWSTFLSHNHSDNLVDQTIDPDKTIAVIFSSGTTSTPKAIPWSSCSALKAAFDGYFHQDIHKNDIVCWPTSLGWMMGHWLIFATFLNGSTLALYNGAPTDSSFIDFVCKEKISILGTVPSLAKAWRQSGCLENHDWQHLRLLSSSGEVANAEDSSYLMQITGNKPIIEYCGGTEISGAYLTSTVLQTNYPASFSTPALGTKLLLLDEQFKPTDKGEVYLCPPALGLSTTLLNKDHEQCYYANLPAGPNNEILRKHGDKLCRLENNYYRALGRSDDSMNLGGIKTSSAEIEQCLLNTPEIKELAAIGQPDSSGGPDQLIIFAVTETMQETDSLKKLLQQQLKKNLNPLFKIQQLILLPSLPKTSSNKIIRKQLKHLLVEELSND